MTLQVHEVMRDRANVLHKFYKGKTVTLIFTKDFLSNFYGGTSKTVLERTNIKAIVDPVTDPKPWTDVGFMSDSTLHMMCWEGFDVEMLNQFYKSAQYDNIKVEIDELLYRVMELKSPESWDGELPYWHFLLQKIETHE